MRITKIDSLRGLGILIVVMGHIDPTPVGNSLIAYFYTFNVPLFFIVSGYLINSKNDSSSINFGKFVLKKIKQILIPYAAFFLISLFYGHVIVRLIFNQYVVPFDFSETFNAFFLSSEWLNRIPTFNFALWFLPLFFLFQLTLGLVCRFLDSTIALIFVLASALCASFWIQNILPGRPPLSINALAPALAFGVIGVLIKRNENLF